MAGRKRALKPVEAFEMRQFREAGMTVRECAKYFNVSVSSAMAYLAELREKLGPEKFTKNGQRARPQLRNSRNLTS